MTTLADREWRLVTEESRPGPMQMALDEIAAETAAEGGPRTVRVYRWEPSTLSLGYHQDPATIDWDFCEQEGITVTRRPTGGGAIYHDNHGDISYSVVAPAEELPGSLLETYERLCQPLLDTLEGIGVGAFFAQDEQPTIHQPACYLRELHPAHDILAGEARKISGNAQYRQRDSVIQHGSVTYERTTERHLNCFVDPPDAGAFRERVTAVREQTGIDRDQVVDTFERTLADWADADVGSWTEEELNRARERAASKYESEAWTRDGDDPT